MQKTNNCGCCEGLSVKTPMEVNNRPGLSAISYRIGTHREFKASLLASLSLPYSKDYGDSPLANLSLKGALKKLTNRDDDDFSIALLDAWATVADVLTFYQERIANESYLGTATEQLSIVELARLIGYELRPGVAASTYLAFTVDESALTAQAPVSGIVAGKSRNEPTYIEVGVKVQSVPGQDEKPQVFETIEKIAAKAEWNAMKLRLTEPQQFIFAASEGPNVLYLNGADNNLKKGDLLLIKSQHSANQSIEFEGVKWIRDVSVDKDLNITRVSFDQPLAVVQVASLLGSLVPNGLINTYLKTSFNSSTAMALSSEIWKGDDFTALVKMNNWDIADVGKKLKIRNANRGSLTINFDSPNQVHVFRNSAPVFGYNAPKEVTYDAEAPPVFNEWNEQESNNVVFLDAEYKEIVPNGFIAIQKKNGEPAPFQISAVKHLPRTAYNMSGKSTRITINNGSNWWGKNDEKINVNYRLISVYMQSEQLGLSEVPLRKVIPEGEVQVELDQFYPDLSKGKAVLFSGEIHEEGVYMEEIKILNEVYYVGDNFTRLVFDQPLAYPYVRNTVTINANVAMATHGETVQEVLGSGDASTPFQKFVLKHNPLTYTSADTPTGTETSLSVRVNDILWKEVPSLYGRGPEERIYITRQNSQTQTTIVFGDGKTGARLPTGQQNVRAVYRKGIGADGLLNADQLSQLMTRPLGVKAVTNPLESVGAQDPEQLEDARANANLTIFTLDRIVSLKDYEDFARAFAGIKKAKAIRAWCGTKQCVHLTVAGVDGAAVEEGNPVFNNLMSAIQKVSISGVTVMIDSYTSLVFKLRARVQVDPDYIAEKVLAAVYEQLNDHFSFEKRDFGKPVALSEVSLVISQVEGVTAVDIDDLYIVNETEYRNDLLSAQVSATNTEKPEPAKLLTIQLQNGDLTLL